MNRREPLEQTVVMAFGASMFVLGLIGGYSYDPRAENFSKVPYVVSGGCLLGMAILAGAVYYSTPKKRKKTENENKH